MRIARFAKRFRRDYAKAKHSGRKIAKLEEVMQLLVNNELLLPKHKDHALRGVWQGTRDCHIEGDWILIYELGMNQDGNDVIIFHATDTHENLFG